MTDGRNRIRKVLIRRQLRLLVRILSSEEAQMLLVGRLVAVRGAKEYAERVALSITNWARKVDWALAENVHASEVTSLISRFTFHRSNIDFSKYTSCEEASDDDALSCRALSAGTDYEGETLARVLCLYSSLMNIAMQVADPSPAVPIQVRLIEEGIEKARHIEKRLRDLAEYELKEKFAGRFSTLNSRGREGLVDGVLLAGRQSKSGIRAVVTDLKNRCAAAGVDPTSYIGLRGRRGLLIGSRDIDAVVNTPIVKMYFLVFGLVAIAGMAVIGLVATLHLPTYMRVLLAFAWLENAAVISQWLLFSNTSAPIAYGSERSVPLGSVAVCVPTLLDSKELIAAVIKMAERNIPEAKSVGASIVILADPVDSTSESYTAFDIDLELYLEQQVDRINRHHGSEVIRFFTRRRVYSASEGRYVAWERKRGKILEFFLASRGLPSTFSDRESLQASFKDVMYAMCIDDDCFITQGSLAALVESARLPSHQPKIDDTGSVISGHAIFIPCSYTSPDASRQWSGNSRLVGPAARAGLEAVQKPIHQLIFGSRPFSGKGLIDVSAFLQSAASRLEDERILSHDIIEGSFLRPLHVNHSSILEGFPSNYRALSIRTHRWIRGDWQNVLLVISRLISNDPNRPRIVTSSVLYIARLARRSLVRVIILAALVLALMLSSREGWCTLGVLFVIISAPQLVDFVASRSLSEKLAAVSEAITGFARTLCTALHQGLVSLDAMVLSVYRWISGRRLLQWKTSYAVESGARNIDRFDWIALSSSGAAFCVMAFLFSRHQLSQLQCTVLTAWSGSLLMAKRN